MANTPIDLDYLHTNKHLCRFHGNDTAACKTYSGEDCCEEDHHRDNHETTKQGADNVVR